MNFGKAIEMLKQGKMVARKGWNGKGMHVVSSKLYTPNNIQVNNDCLLLFNVTKKYNMSDVMYFKLSEQDMRRVINGIYEG